MNAFLFIQSRHTHSCCTRIGSGIFLSFKFQIHSLKLRTDRHTYTHTHTYVHTVPLELRMGVHAFKCDEDGNNPLSKSWWMLHRESVNRYSTSSYSSPSYFLLGGPAFQQSNLMLISICCVGMMSRSFGPANAIHTCIRTGTLKRRIYIDIYIYIYFLLISTHTHTHTMSTH